MNAIVVYESIFGNTHEIARAVAAGLGGAEVLTVAQACARAIEPDLVVVGAPTHMHSIPTSASRRLSVREAAQDGADHHLEPGAAEGPELRVWLRSLPFREGARAATFDTRLNRASWLTGVASHAIARRLRRRGYEIVDIASFLVTDAEGPLEDGELDRARAWGVELARTYQHAHV